MVLFLSTRASSVSTTASSNKASIGSPGVPGAVVRFAAQSHVAAVKRLGPATSTGLGWFTGTDPAGQVVVAVGSSRGFGPFVPIDRVLEAGMSLYSEDGGATLNSVGWRELAGLVRPGIGRVELVLESGRTKVVTVVDHAFVYSAARPGPFPVEVRAYDGSGNIVATRDLLPPSAPGTG
jgi:hypothetical protein